MTKILLAIFRARSLWILALLIAAIYILAFGMEVIIQGAVESILLPFGFLGAAAGWGLAKSRLKGRLAIGVIVIGGIIALFIRIARLDIPAFNLFLSTPLVNAKVMLWLYDRTIPDFSHQLAIYQDLAGRAGGFIIRLGEYIRQLSTGFDSDDLVSRAFIWGYIVWLISAWSGWMLVRGKNALIALAPAIVLLAFISDYTNKGFVEIWLLLLITITLMSLTRYDSQTRYWKSKGMDFSDSISWDTTFAISFVLFAVALITWFTPSISVKAMVDAIREIREPQKNTVATSLGLIPASEFGDTKPYVSPGLPRNHLLTGGPDLDKTVALVISTGEKPINPFADVPGPLHRYYWRDVIFDVYTGSGWTSSPIEDLDYPADQQLIETSPPNYRPVQQIIKSFNTSDNRLYWTGVLLSSNQPLQVAWRKKPDSTSQDLFNGTDMLGALVQVKEYKVESLLPMVSENQLRAASNKYPARIRSRYTNLPDIPERVLSLTRDITASATTPYDRAKAIEGYLRQIPYSLEVPPPPAGRDVADYFLFDLKKGYCDYYATTMVVMARASGLPARLVTGYAPGNYDPFSATYVVTENQAHSWVEIYFPDYGWIEFEPTAAYPTMELAGEDTVQPVPILPLNQDKGFNLWQILNHLPQGAKTTILTFAGLLWQTLSHLPQGAKTTILPFVGLLLMVFIWTIIDKWVIFRRPVASSLTVIFKRMERMGNRLSHEIRSGETPYEFSALIQKQIKPYTSRRFSTRIFGPGIKEVEFITQLYVEAIFSQNTPARNEALKAFTAWSNLRWRLSLIRFLHLFGKKSKRVLS